MRDNRAAGEEGGIMTIKELVKKNRTCRRFHQEVAVERETLRDLIDLARLSASAANLQPVRPMVYCNLAE
jgi:nitroreductase